MADDITLGGEQLTPQDQAALDRARGVTNDDTNPYNEDGSLKNEPVEIPEKFKGKSLEDVVKAYTELEKKLSEKQATIPENEPTPKVQQDAVEAKVNAALTPKDFEVYEKAYLENGKLDDNHYKELEKKGLSKEIIDLYIEGAKARDTIYTNAIYEAAGGEAEYKDLVKWAGENITDQSVIADINRDLTSGNVAKAKWAVENLQLRRGTPPRKLEGSSVADTATKVYKDKSEWRRDVSNALYGRDKKYTQAVDARYLVSKKRGTL